MVHDMYVYEVKKPSESKGEWDYCELREVIPEEEAFRPLKAAQGQRLPAGQEGLDLAEFRAVHQEPPAVARVFCSGLRAMHRGQLASE